MGREINSKSSQSSGDNSTHLDAVLGEIQRSQVKRYLKYPESAPIQMPCPTADRIRDLAETAWENRLEPIFKTLNDIRESPSKELRSSKEHSGGLEAHEAHEKRRGKTSI